eukprot:gene23557-28528_t
MDPVAFVHLGNAFAVLALGMQEMLPLRLLMVCASFCGIIFNLLQTPVPMLAPAAWGVFFVIGHLVQISILLNEQRPVTLTEEELQVYLQIERYGFTPRRVLQFLRLVRDGGATWREYKVGERIVNDGNVVQSIFYIKHGAAEVVAKGEKVGTIEAGAMIGELGMLPREQQSQLYAKGHWHSTITATQ